MVRPLATKIQCSKMQDMHVGHKLPTIYHIRDGQNTEKLSVVEEKDLGVFTTNKLKSDRQCAAASAKAMSVLLGDISRKLTSIASGSCIRPTYTRPHLEYCIQAWSPHLMKDIECLESVQRRATKYKYKYK